MVSLCLLCMGYVRNRCSVIISRLKKCQFFDSSVITQLLIFPLVLKTSSFYSNICFHVSWYHQLISSSTLLKRAKVSHMNFKHSSPFHFFLSLYFFLPSSSFFSLSLPAPPFILFPAFLPFFYFLSLTSFSSSFLIPFSLSFSSEKTSQEIRNRKKKKTEQWSIRRQSHEFEF